MEKCFWTEDLDGMERRAGSEEGVVERMMEMVGEAEISRIRELHRGISIAVGRKVGLWETEEWTEFAMTDFSEAILDVVYQIILFKLKFYLNISLLKMNIQKHTNCAVIWIYLFHSSIYFLLLIYLYVPWQLISFSLNSPLWVSLLDQF